MRMVLLSNVPGIAGMLLRDSQPVIAQVLMVVWAVMLVGGCLGAALGGARKGL